MSVRENLKAVNDRIAAAAKRAGRDPSTVTLVAVTKTVSPERVREAVAAGASVLGENRVQEAREKIELLGPIARWHLIGTLQKNKAKYAVKLFDLIHSLDGLELAHELDRQAARAGRVQDVLVEVNIAAEASKTGAEARDVMDLVREASVLPHIRVRGLMAIPPYTEDPEASRPHFRKLRELRDAILKEDIPGLSLGELSMGMSGDFEVAIEEGATLVRVGTAIFGDRA